MVVVDQVSLRAGVAHRMTTVVNFLPFLFFVDFLFFFLCLHCLLNVKLAQANEVIKEILRNLHGLLGM